MMCPECGYNNSFEEHFYQEYCEDCITEVIDDFVFVMSRLKYDYDYLVDLLTSINFSKNHFFIATSIPKEDKVRYSDGYFVYNLITKMFTDEQVSIIDELLVSADFEIYETLEAKLAKKED